MTEPCHEKTNILQISLAVTGKLISAFIFAAWIVQFPYFLNLIFNISSPKPSSVLVQLGLCQTILETALLVFSCHGSYVLQLVTISDTFSHILSNEPHAKIHVSVPKLSGHGTSRLGLIASQNLF